MIHEQRPDLHFRELRGVERSYVRLREQVLVPANRSISAAEMIRASAWPDVTVLPLTIYHHNLIVTWTQLPSSVAAAGSPIVDWRHFVDR